MQHEVTFMKQQCSFCWIHYELLSCFYVLKYYCAHIHYHFFSVEYEDAVFFESLPPFLFLLLEFFFPEFVQLVFVLECVFGGCLFGCSECILLFEVCLSSLYFLWYEWYFELFAVHLVFSFKLGVVQILVERLCSVVIHLQWCYWCHLWLMQFWVLLLFFFLYFFYYAGTL